MKINDLNIFQKSHYYKDSDIFNLKPPKSPDKFNIKRISINLDDDINNRYNNLNGEKYYVNKKDHVNDCLRYKNWMDNYEDKYKMYKTVDHLRKESKKIQLDKSYDDYKYMDHNKMYISIRLNHKKGNLSLGDYMGNFCSEYNSMNGYMNKMILKNKVGKNKIFRLNKSMDIPHKFKSLKSQNYKRRSYINELFTQNTADLDLNKSTDNILMNNNNKEKKKKNMMINKLKFYKSNIFFDKNKAKANEELSKYIEDNKNEKKNEKLRLKKLQKEKSHPNIIRKKQNYFFEERPKKQPKNIEELKQFLRDGNFPLPYSNYKPVKNIKISSIDDVTNSKNKKLYNGVSEKERNTEKFIVLGIANNNKFDAREIKNLFANNGIHMFGDQTYNSYIENGKKGKFVFSIRKDLNDKNYNQKMEKIQNILLKKQGITFNIDNRKMNYNKKVRKDISPIILSKNKDE